MLVTMTPSAVMTDTDFVCFCLAQPVLSRLDYHSDKDGNLHDKHEDMATRSVLMAHFWMARLATKFVGMKKEDQLISQQQSLVLYRYIVNYYDRHGCDNFDDEIAICREMLELAPLKIAQLKRQIAAS
eukprot:TRINITY_DN11636_c0_g1_i1.p1 TRINITY_DN11636_c0_g1~~TRINITY_DN11636_c0_g1_i1.p1  ORF type:complete len:128 (+),score=35.91 TRINITY_DN11636_c0_g1_i1:285-668(+)